jgi:hypothetical protein
MDHAACAGWWTWLTVRLPLLGSPQLIKRIAMTLFYLGLVRIGYFIVVPGVDVAAMKNEALAGARPVLLLQMSAVIPAAPQLGSSQDSAARIELSFSGP